MDSTGPSTARRQFPLLFSGIDLGTRTSRNRIIFPAHTTGYTRDSIFTPQLVDYYEERARGGAGVIVTQPCYVTSEYGAIKASDDSIIGEFAKLTSAVHKHGSLVFAQLSHPGAQGAYSGTEAANYLGPSAVPIRKFGIDWRTPREMTREQILDVIDGFAQAARRCTAAELDGVELHFAHGNLVDQFLSRDLNRRSDEWGGTLDSRLRLALRIVDAVRDALGQGYVLGVRLTGFDFDGAESNRGLRLQSERLEAAGLIAESGAVDYLSLSVGHYSDALATARNIPDMSFAPGVWSSQLADVSRAINLPIAIVGRINHPTIAERLLADGSCQLVAMVRALIADPFLPEKARTERVSEIRPCVGAVEGCWGNVYRGRPMRCVYNAAVGREALWPERNIARASQPRQVLVVGGGPSGMECARVAALRGHVVTLVEQEKSVGGQLKLASQAPYRAEMAMVIEWLYEACIRAGVDVRCGISVDHKYMEDAKPDAVVIATGAVPDTARCIGFEHEELGWDLLAGRVDCARLGERVIVYDEEGTREGVSVVEWLLERQVSVTWVTPMETPGASLDPFSMAVVFERLQGRSLEVLPLHEIVRDSDPGTITMRSRITGKKTRMRHALVSVPLRVASDGLMASVGETAATVLLVGDAVAPRTLEMATADGYKAGLRL